MKYEVFISYSHEDSDRIAPVIALVRAMKNDSVFQDSRNIKPGERWKPQLLEALRRAKTVIVFWCEHSAKSEYVKEEYEVALEEEKDILPLLMDDTKLPDSLAEFQWIDLRGQRFHAPWVSVVSRPFERGNRHFYPRDEHGEYVDWESEWASEDYRKSVEAHTELSKDAAERIVRELEKREAT